MSKVSIEPVWWTDPRRHALIDLLGDEWRADGMMIRVWLVAQQFWTSGGVSFYVPERELTRHGIDLEILIKCNLATRKNDKFIYINGSRKFFNWLKVNRANASKGGKKKAENAYRSLGFGHVPNDNDNGNGNGKNNTNTPGEEKPPSVQAPQASKKSVGVKTVYSDAFEATWQLYRRKGNKLAAYTEYRQTIPDADCNNQLGAAIRQYLSTISERRYQKDLERFLKMDWRQYLDGAKSGPREISLEDLKNDKF